MMLGQIQSDVPKLFAEWAACLAFALLLINEGIKFAKTVRGKSGQPPNEQLQASQDNLARRVDGLEDSVEKLRDEVRQNHDAAKRDGSIRSKTLFDGMNGMRKELTNHIEDVRKELSDSQRTLPNEIVALLRNTGAIKH